VTHRESRLLLLLLLHNNKHQHDGDAKKEDGMEKKMYIETKSSFLFA
jgi:hypothetical protein